MGLPYREAADHEVGGDGVDSTPLALMLVRPTLPLAGCCPVSAQGLAKTTPKPYMALLLNVITPLA